MAPNYSEVMAALESVVNAVNGHEKQIKIIFEYLKQFEQTKQQKFDQQQRERIGYKAKK